MIFVADASVDHPITIHLRSAGHVVHAVKEIAPRLTDEAVLALANRHDAVLITADKDFGEMVVRARRSTAGVVLLRLAGLRTLTKAEIVVGRISDLADGLRGTFTVIGPSTIRMRPLAQPGG
jgi:predicted nuclease of predicted toxin-antitoxin system